MNTDWLQAYCTRFVSECNKNRVTLPDGTDISLFESPLLGFSSAEDPLYMGLLAPAAIGPHFLLPGQWLQGAGTVISFFLPFSQEVRMSNRRERTCPSQAWLYGRVEGQEMVSALAHAVREVLEEAGFACEIPAESKRFFTVSRPKEEEGLSFTSNWSERHVAYISGLGTFGLSRGLITEKGMAGRFGSVITTWQGTPTERTYQGLYDRCSGCGACVRRCPGGAITLETGKDHARCLSYQETIVERCLPRYGCGFCQTGVPCEHGVPVRI